VLQQIAKAGAMPAVAVNPSTPLAAVEEVLGDAGMILVMSVNPGFGGQSFIPGAVDKIRRLRLMAEQRGIGLDIEVDGGINERTAAQVVAAGANVLVAGSFVFGSRDYRAAVAALRGGPSPA
jgi:ribulose-phosphate 3-epimerase